MIKVDISNVWGPLSLPDLLAIEQRLTQVQQEIQSVTSQLKALDSQIEYATIHLSISEVVEYDKLEMIKKLM